MTTENGLEKVMVARRKIEVLQTRHDYLVKRIAEREAVGLGPANGYLDAERSALEWALPILEAEWDALVRMRRVVGLVVPEGAAGLAAEYGSEEIDMPR